MTSTTAKERQHGQHWHPVAGRRLFYPTFIIHPDEPQMRLPEHTVIDILPGEPHHLEVLPPATRPANATAVQASVTLRDIHDNRLAHQGNVAMDNHHSNTDGFMRDGLARGDLQVPQDQVIHVHAHLQDNASGLEARSNLCVPSDDLQLYFGDLHCHDMHSEAMGYPDEVYRFAIEDRRLDFFSPSVQTHGGLGNAKCAIHKYMNERYLNEGSFVTFLACEWQHSAFADKVIHFLGGDQPYLPVRG